MGPASRSAFIGGVSLTTFSAPSRRLVFTGKQQVSLESFTPPGLKPGDVHVRIQRTLMSTGTENIVFNRLFDHGTHWDNWVKYPFYPGYAAVGVIEAVGSAVGSLKVGDRVACRTGHASTATLEEARCFPIPDALDWEEAVWFSLAKIAFHGAQAAEYRLGDRVLIIGAGPIGQMAVRWAFAAGCASLLMTDAVPDRMALARAVGATATLVGAVDAMRDAVREACDGQLPRVVIDSTGNAAVFSAALGLVADHGRVVILGDTGQPARQGLTSDVIVRGVNIVGAHDGHNTAQWDNRTIAALFFRLAASGRFSVENLVTHRFHPEACEEAYATANRDRAKTMGILFDWSAQ